MTRRAHCADGPRPGCEHFGTDARRGTKLQSLQSGWTHVHKELILVIILVILLLGGFSGRFGGYGYGYGHGGIGIIGVILIILLVLFLLGRI